MYDQHINLPENNSESDLSCQNWLDRVPYYLHIYSIFTDGLLFSLQSSDVGCHIDCEHIGCMAYEMMSLLSRHPLYSYKQCLICVRFGDEMDIKFNAKKSCLFKVGRNYKDFVNNLLLGDVINWSANLKYLGVQFLSATYLKVDISPCVRKFYASVNAIYHHTKYVTEITRLSA